jgi:uncharacterized protein with GYD domain
VPLYLSRFRYESRTWAKLVHDPSQRRQGVRDTLEAAGCQLHDFWYTMGDADGYVMFESPDERTALTYLAVTSGRGNVRTLETTRLFTVEEMVTALEAARGLPTVPELPE